ncbi:MAG TPA: ABC-F family ATP-binding cassette domain-containing protein [Actinocrinis sp.]|nr:ABC-F family ATP-binding cassette domain-containing protein [Actinocrinis sp.]
MTTTHLKTRTPAKTRAYLKARGLSHHYDGELLFSGVDFVLNPGERVGLVGPNGVGKSTLLALLTGRLEPVSGVVTAAPGTRIGWFEQQAPDPDATVGDRLAEGLGEIGALADRLHEIEQALTGQGDDVELDEYGDLQERWTALRGWTAQSRQSRVRTELGLDHLADDTPLSQISGGEQARLTLAGLLQAEPDVLVLDEPTNHLDTQGIAWLGRYLAGFRGGVLMVTHDRALLDDAVTRIIELDGIHDEPQHYEGGYTAYHEEKARRWQSLLLEYEAQEKYRERLAADIEATKGHATSVELATKDSTTRRYAKKVAKKAKARERRLERQIQSARWIARPQTRPALTLAFSDEAEAIESGSAETAASQVSGMPESGRVVLAARELGIKLGGRPILDAVDVEVQAGQRIAVTGPNGAGKTTLLRILAGELAPDTGRLVVSTTLGILPQTHDGLRTETTVVEFLRSRVPLHLDDAEALLDGYLFGPDQWNVPISTLSAGELRRLLLAVLVNSRQEILVLDEPTNYLDFDALDVVEEALRAYKGMLIMVTHDRYFADRVGLTHTWTLEHGTVRVDRQAGRRQAEN